MTLVCEGYHEKALTGTDTVTGGGFATIYGELGWILSIKNAGVDEMKIQQMIRIKRNLKPILKPGRVGFNVQVTGRVSCSKSGCSVDGRVCASLRGRIWFKLKAAVRWWETAEEYQGAACTSWVPIYTIAF